MSAADPMVLRIAAALGDLAECDDPDAIEAFLAREGVRGRRGSPCDCPVAVFVHRRTGEWISVDEGGWSYYGRHGYRWGDLPGVVAAFVREFDSGGYPALTREVPA